MADFWGSTPRMTMVAWQAYERRWGKAAWFAGAAGKFKDLTFEQLVGQAQKRTPMSLDQMAANLGAGMAAHNAALAARGKE